LIGVRQVTEVMQEADELCPAIGVHVDELPATEEEPYLARAALEGRRRVVERRGPCAEHRDALSRERSEIDVRTRLRIAILGESLSHERGHLPEAGAVDAGRKNDPTGE